MEIVNWLSLFIANFGSDRFNFVRHPDVGLNIEQLTFKYGYPLEVHRLQSDDGYFLKTHRIRHGRFSNTTNPHPVLLVHGTCACADVFLTLGEDSIAYFLADRGFDVWLMNDRGNKYSRKHKYLNPNTDRQFWEYTWHEIGVYDIPANIDYILKVTNKLQLTYIGHSQGTTEYFVLLSERPEYNEKLNVGVVMAPSALFEYTNSLGRVIAKNHKLFQDVFDFFGIYEMFPNGINEMIQELGKFLCSEQNIFVDLCNLGFQFLDDSGQMDLMTAQRVLSVAPSRCAVRQMTHYFQIAHAGVFRQYDYGVERNLQIYGAEIPRNYSFGNILAPTIYMYAEIDTLCTVKDVEKIIALTKRAESIKIPKFNHVDFIVGKDAKQWALEPMYKLLHKYLI